jgi:hypothetical protein
VRLLCERAHMRERSARCGSRGMLHAEPLFAYRERVTEQNLGFAQPALTRANLTEVVQ